MGVVERFERRLEGLVGDAFARVFGGKVVPQEVAQALQREAEAGVRPLAGGRLLAPNRYVVTLGATDHSRLTGDEQRVIGLLRGYVEEYLAECGWETYGGVVVDLKRSETLRTGQFRANSSVDPESSSRVPAQSHRGDRAMSQRSGQYPADDQRGQYGGYGYDQGYQQGADYDQRYGYGYGYPPQGYDQSYGGYRYDRGGYGGYYYDHGYEQYGQYQSPQPSPAWDPGIPGAYAYDQGYGPGSYPHDRGGYRGYAPDPQGYGPPPAAGPGQLTAVLTVDDGTGRSYHLSPGSNVIGRGQDAQFRLPDTGVSRRHLEITWDGRNATLSDLGSTNGTGVNGHAVQTWQLADGDVIRVGHTALVFRNHG